MPAPDLAGKIARRIRREGPLSIAAFMAMALHDPESGYYVRRAPIGRGGDFITAPEISQVFGELIGLWSADFWQRIGQPDRIVLAELGPGRGTLMSDLLRAARAAPAFHRAIELFLMEASPVLRAEQQHRLAGNNPRFVDSIDAVPAGPLLLIANEFLDALPIRQLIRRADGWAERFVGVDTTGALGFSDGPASAAIGMLVRPEQRDAAIGTIVEICPAATALAGALGARLSRQPGAALFIDYGYFPGAAGPTLSAVRGHAAAGILDDPGGADLSAHVDFAAFAEAAGAAGAAVHGPVTQSRFLTELGVVPRLATLSASASAAQRDALESGVRRLIDPDQMGNLFKVLALTSPGLPVPAGFAPASPRGGEQFGASNGRS
ncbi:MAG TPA: SAM-dependent methyltransferase [Stellaceae bacterium]|jgi:NADH dehydrogenase [ubiquinone] 1 alpha subcomplex assembly factor 7|nr:SAM-dependent methyltransferase [Stellaceae bacterium]